MKKYLPVMLLFGIVSLVLAACSPVAGIVGIATVPPAATAQQVVPQPAIREAQVTGVEVRFSDKTPSCSGWMVGSG